MIDQEIYHLIERFEHSSLTGLKLSTSQFTLELGRNQPSAPAVRSTHTSSPMVPPEPEAEPAHTISAPLVGTFYTSPAPDQAPFVSVGSKVSKGQTVCLLEAMKMMQEVPAPCNCIIESVLKENGELAAYGEALFGYRPC